MTRSRDSRGLRWAALSARTALLYTVSLVVGARPAQAGINAWTSHRPESGMVQALGFDPIEPHWVDAATNEGGVFAIEQMSACVGDCDDKGTVTVDELVKGVNIALGTATLDDCDAFDSSNDGTVTVDELVTAVNAALNGCGGPGVWYADERAPSGADGRSWTSAFRFVADALAAAHAGDTIRVAQGIYRPDCSATNPGGNGDRRATFHLRNGVELRGGYAGLGAAEPDAIDLALHPSTLSGDLAGDDGADFENNGENSLHVVTGSGTTSSAIIDGFTISGGNASGPAGYPDADQIGGGMLNWHDESPTVVHCTFEGNSAEYAGAGMANGFGSSPKISDCSFTGNVAVAEVIVPDPDTLDSGGGGIVNGAGSNPEITRCTFRQNRASGGAGILNELGAAPTVVGCTFEGNVTTIANGGGMYSLKQALPYVRDCIFRSNVSAHVGGALSFRSTPSDVWIINSLFDGNQCADGGGGVRAGNSSSVHVVNCTFVGNSADGNNPLFAGRAGGLDVGSDGKVALRTSTIDNSVFWGNTADGQPRQLALQGLWPAGLVVRYSDVQGGQSGIFVQRATFPLTWGAGNIDVDPLFVSEAAYDFRLTADSPCVDGGDPGAVPSDVTTDLAGNPRLAAGGASIDMGPYQSAGSP